MSDTTRKLTEFCYRCIFGGIVVLSLITFAVLVWVSTL